MLIIQKWFSLEVLKDGWKSNSPLQKQTIDELNISIFSSGCNRFVHISIVALITLRHKVYFSFRITFRAFVGLPLPQLFAHKESVFSFQLFKRCIDFFFFHVRTDHDGRKHFLRQMQKKILWREEVMERKPHVSF